MVPYHSRREFIEAAGYGAAALAAVGYGKPAFGANDTLGIGLIGCGGRMHIHLAPALLKIPGVKVVAACDVYSEHRESIAHKVGTLDLPVTVDHHELLARPDVDAVVIATPDHLHVPLMIDACKAGKDVYCEKPFTHNLTEGAAAIEAQNQHKRIVQIGTQQRSMTHLIEAKQLVDQGVLGKVRKVRMTWNRNASIGKPKYNIKPEQVDWKRFLGNAPDQAFDPHRLRNWRWFWDFGGGIFTDLMVHWYDTVNWMTGLGIPEAAVSIGDHFASKDIWETPDTVQTLLHYPGKGAQAHFEGTFVTQRGKAHAEIMGEDATLYIDRGRYELIPEPGRSVEAKSLVLGSGDPGADFYDKPDGELLHLGQWIDCVRSRVKPNCPAEAGVEAAYTAWLANKALREGGMARLS